MTNYNRIKTYKELLREIDYLKCCLSIDEYVYAACIGVTGTNVKILGCVKSYINAIRYKNADSISSFKNSTLDLYSSSRNEFNLSFKVIKKFIKLLSMQNESIDSKIGFNEFEDLASIVSSKYINMNHTDLVKNIEDFHQSLDANANPQLSLMNMIINSNKALN